jgi:para-nitrobenzyl esterase
MIYGQSGGGSKVTTLLGMPSASGLIHRAAAQSGGGGNIPTKEQQREVARVMMKDLGLAPNDIGALQKMDWPKPHRRRQRGRHQGQPPRPWLLRPRPSRAPRASAGHPRRRQEHQHALVLRRRAGGEQERSHPHRLRLGRGQQHDLHPTERSGMPGLAKTYGEEKADRHHRHPQSQLPQKQSRRSLTCAAAAPGSTVSPCATTSSRWRAQARPQCRSRLRLLLHLADTAVRQPPGAWHTAELQFCFDNTKRCEQGTGNTPEAQALAKKMASAWAAFAATGNPSCPASNGSRPTRAPTKP